MAPEIVCLPQRTAEELEHLRAKRAWQYDERVDVWALGCLAFELLFGRSPFKAADSQSISNAIAASPLIIPPSPAIPVSASELIQQALCKNPSLRPSATALSGCPWLLDRSNVPAPWDAADRARQVLQRPGQLATLTGGRSTGASTSLSGHGAQLKPQAASSSATGGGTAPLPVLLRKSQTQTSGSGGSPTKQEARSAGPLVQSDRGWTTPAKSSAPQGPAPSSGSGDGHWMAPVARQMSSTPSGGGGAGAQPGPAMSPAITRLVEAVESGKMTKIDAEKMLKRIGGSLASGRISNGGVSTKPGALPALPLLARTSSDSGCLMLPRNSTESQRDALQLLSGGSLPSRAASNLSSRYHNPADDKHESSSPSSPAATSPLSSLAAPSANLPVGRTSVSTLLMRNLGLGGDKAAREQKRAAGGGSGSYATGSAFPMLNALMPGTKDPLSRQNSNK